MADLDDLGFLSITEVSQDEALERLRQIRLSRRAPNVTKSKPQRSPKAQKPAEITQEMAAEILRILKGDS